MRKGGNVATERQPLSAERRQTIRLAARASAIGPKRNAHMDPHVFEAAHRGLPVLLAEWETPAREIQERLAVHAHHGQYAATILIRQVDRFVAMKAQVGSDLPPIHIRGNEVHASTPIGEVWDVLEHMARSAEWVPNQFAARTRKAPAGLVGQFEMSLA